MSSNKSFPALLEEIAESKDVSEILHTQKNTLRSYEETNEMLRQFLDLSDTTQKMLLENYNAHSKTLVTLKKDLENSFKRIRALKGKLKQKYPDAFESTVDAIKELENRYTLDDTEKYRTIHSIDLNEKGESYSTKSGREDISKGIHVDNVDGNSCTTEEHFPVPNLPTESDITNAVTEYMNSLSCTNNEQSCTNNEHNENSLSNHLVNEYVSTGCSIDSPVLQTDTVIDHSSSVEYVDSLKTLVTSNSEPNNKTTGDQ